MLNLDYLSDSEKKTVTKKQATSEGLTLITLFPASGGYQLTLLSASGLYKLVMRSENPERSSLELEEELPQNQDKPLIEAQPVENPHIYPFLVFEDSQVASELSRLR